MSPLSTRRFSASFACTTFIAACLFLLMGATAMARVVKIGRLPAEYEQVGQATDRTVVPVEVNQSPSGAQTVRALTSWDLSSCDRISSPVLLPPIQLPQRLDIRPELTPAANQEPSACNAKWIVYEWQMRADALGGQVQLKEISYSQQEDKVTVVGESTVQTLTPNQVNTFSLNQPVQPPTVSMSFAAAIIGTGSAPFSLRGGGSSGSNGFLSTPGIMNLAGNLPTSSEVGLQVGNVDTTKQVNMLVKLETDFDADSIRDSIDTDIDGDGILNDRDNCRWVANPDQTDKNHNGVGIACNDNVEDWENWRDQLLASDHDRDGISFAREMQVKTDVCDSDSDDDGIADGKELRIRTNPKQFDTDGDKLGDGLELGIRRVTGDTQVATQRCYDSRPGQPMQRPLLATKGKRFRFDRQPKTKTNPRKRDTDHDGVSDGREDRNRNGRRDRGERDPLRKG